MTRGCPRLAGTDPTSLTVLSRACRDRATFRSIPARPATSQKNRSTIDQVPLSTRLKNVDNDDCLSRYYQLMPTKTWLFIIFIIDMSTSKTGNLKKSDILAIKFRRSDDWQNSGDLYDSNWRHKCRKWPPLDYPLSRQLQLGNDQQSRQLWPSYDCQSRQLQPCDNHSRVVSYYKVTTHLVVS